jgi:hypothetical protein
MRPHLNQQRGAVVHISYPSDVRKHKIQGSWFGPEAKSETLSPISNITRVKSAGDVA